MGGGGQTTTTTTPPPTEEERELTRLNTQLAQKQLTQMNELEPFQRELIAQSMTQLKGQAVIDAAITPEQRAAQAKAEFDREMRMGPMQDELLQMQMDQMRQGGKATPEQLAQIKEATDAAIASGSEDIDITAKRGLNMIADEAANARGLRLTDSPMSSEAALLQRGAQDQKGSLIKTLRAAEAQAALSHPLAIQQLQSGINMGQQGLFQSAQQFQQQLKNQAYQNSLQLTGNSGIGIAGIASGVGSSTLGSLTQARIANTTETVKKKAGFGEKMQAIGTGVGVGMMVF